MTAINFRASINFIMGPTRDGSRDDSAPGEAFKTVRGITQMTWDNAVERGLVTGRLEDMTDDQEDAIYRTNYWNALRCDALPSGVDLMVFNDGVLAGDGHAAQLLQRIVGAKPDGSIGDLTLKAVEAYVALWGVASPAIQPDVPHQLGLIDAIADGDIAFFKSLAKAPLFLRGWTRRENDAATLAYQLAGINYPRGVTA